MKVVLLEGLGVSEQVIEQHARKLESMGHTFVAYPKNTDPLVQAEWSRDADVIMLANMPLAPVVLEEAKNLKFIDVAFTGVDHIPMAEAKQRGIAVSNASGYATQAVAELCVSFMIQLLRNVGKTEERCRNGGTKDGLVGNLLCGKTVGIVGAGAIGKKVAALCKAFGCSVLAYNRSTVSDPAIDEQVSLEELLKRSDIVSLHCPQTPENVGMIDKTALAKMKDGVILLNTARGGLINEADLRDALLSGKVYAAASDVVSTEPIRADNPLLGLDNMIITPHIAWASHEARQRLMDTAVENVRNFLNGTPSNNVAK